MNTTNPLTHGLRGGHRRDESNPPGPAPSGMRWHRSAVTGQWHLEVA